MQNLSQPGYVLDNDDSFRVVSCLYKLFGSRLQIGHIQIRTGTTTPLVKPFLVTKWFSLPNNHYPFFVTPTGLEPVTRTLKVYCASQLRYGVFPYIFKPSTTFFFQAYESTFYQILSIWPYFSDWADWFIISMNFQHYKYNNFFLNFQIFQ